MFVVTLPMAIIGLVVMLLFMDSDGDQYTLGVLYPTYLCPFLIVVTLFFFFFLRYDVYIQLHYFVHFWQICFWLAVYVWGLF